MEDEEFAAFVEWRNKQAAGGGSIRGSTQVPSLSPGTSGAHGSSSSANSLNTTPQAMSPLTSPRPVDYLAQCLYPGATWTLPPNYCFFRSKPSVACIVHRCEGKKKRGAPLAVAFWHGNGESIEDYAHGEFVKDFESMGVSIVVLFEYRGYGRFSEDRQTPWVVREDASRAAQFLQNTLRLAPENIVLYGRSMGSLHAIHAAQALGKKCRGLVIESGFSSEGFIRFARPRLEKAGDNIAEFEQRVRTELRLTETLASAGVPVLILHAEDDTIVPLENALQNTAALPEQNTRFHRFKVGKHNVRMFHGEWMEQLVQFLDE